MRVLFAVAIVAIVIVAGCIGQKESANRGVLQGIRDQVDSLTEYTADYEYTETDLAEETATSLTFHEERYGGLSRADIGLGGEASPISVYHHPLGNYTCFEKSCSKEDLAGKELDVVAMDLLDAIIESDSLEEIKLEGRNTIAGRECQRVYLKGGAGIRAFGTVSRTGTSELNACFDIESGIPLYIDVRTEDSRRVYSVSNLTLRAYPIGLPTQVEQELGLSRTRQVQSETPERPPVEVVVPEE